MSEVSDRVAKGMVRAIHNAPFDPSQTPLQREMNALLSHGLREFILAARNVIDESVDEPLSLRLEMALRRLDATFTALSADPPTVKGEK